MKLIKAVVTAGIAALVITSLPDIKRYFELNAKLLARQEQTLLRLVERAPKLRAPKLRVPRLRRA